MHTAVLLHLKVIALLWLSSLEVTNGATVEYYHDELEASESLLPEVIIMANTTCMYMTLCDYGM